MNISDRSLLDRNSAGQNQRRASIPKLAALAFAEIALLAIIGGAFWYQDFKYSLPTPRPANFVAPPVGKSLQLPAHLAAQSDSRPLVLNFYSGDCTCSRFNLDHLKRLVKTYGSRALFVLIPEGGTQQDQEKLFHDLDLDAEAYYDPEGKLARDLGVYATPEAVVLDSQRRLVYRGNYNTGRYCTDPNTEFVRLALDNVVSGAPLPTFMAKPIPTYGCAIAALWKDKEVAK